MTIELNEPGVDGMREIVDVLREWQSDDAPMQLHPGDLGWAWRFGTETIAATMRTWRRDGRLLAIGMHDGQELLRMTVAPDARHDEELARRVAADASDPGRGVLGEGTVYIDAPRGILLQDVLGDNGWAVDDPWTPLRRDLTEPLPEVELRIEVVGPKRVDERVAVQRAAFEKSTFTAERWHAMADGLPYADARCLLGYDENDNAVAAVTVWSAGEGRPGLLEPMGVHRDHRGGGHGRAITIAAAAALREMGSSSAIVATPSSYVGAVATYRAAGFQQLPEVHDRRRDG